MPVFMLTIRLSRLGRTKKYAYRLVLQDHREAVKGEAIEILGNYQPALPKKPLVIKKERVEYWLSKGAWPSDTVAVILKKEGFSNMEKFIAPRNRKRSKKDEKASEPAPAPAEAKPLAKPPEAQPA